MNNQLTGRVSARSVFKFTIPTIILMIFMSLYSIVDGVFVSRLIGTSALSAVNIVYPILSVTLAVGIMLATGGSAVIARKLGEGKEREAKENFTLIVMVGIVAGIFLSLICLLTLEPLLYLLGANEAIFQYCWDYALPCLYFLPLSVLQMLMQYFIVTAGKPNLGLGLTAAGGIANILLDYVFIAELNMGIAGAAIATGIGYTIPALTGLIYFWAATKGKGGSMICFAKPKWDGKMLLHSCLNGSSEMVTNMSAAVITILFNVVMMRMLGEDGVAAITIVLYAEFLLIAMYLGYSSGIAPVISYNYGANDEEQLRKLFKISMYAIAATSLLVFAASLLFAPQIVTVFAGSNDRVYSLAVHGFYLYSFSYIGKGLNIYASAMFTAFSNGKVSAILSFMRTFVFIVVGMALLSWLLGVDGVWLAVPFAEFVSVILSIGYILKFRKIYRYA